MAFRFVCVSALFFDGLEIGPAIHFDKGYGTMNSRIEHMEEQIF